jgi:hypothetical protein
LTWFNNSLSDKSHFIDNKPKPIPHLIEKDHDERYKDVNNQLQDEDIKDAIATITGNELMIDNSKSNKYNNVDDPLLEEMQRQSKV